MDTLTQNETNEMVLMADKYEEGRQLERTEEFDLTADPEATHWHASRSREASASQDVASSQAQRSPRDPSGVQDPSEHSSHGRFRLVERLGESDRGEIYRAIHVRLRKTVALRLLPAELLDGKGSQERFQHMIRTIGRLSNPHLVRLENAGHHDGRPYLVMEHVPGLDFQALVGKVGTLAAPEACQLVGQALLGVACLQEHGLVDGQLAPARLRLSAPSGAVKITDTGLARLLEYTDQKCAGHFQGAPCVFRAPEQNEHGTADVRSDIYALGCTLYFLMTGEPPVVAQHRDGVERLPRLADKSSEVPAGLQPLVDRMTAADPALRFERPLEVAGLLSGFAVGCDLLALLKRVDLAAAPRVSGSNSSIHSAAYLETASPQRANKPRRGKHLAAAVLLAFGVTAAASPFVLPLLSWKFFRGKADKTQSVTPNPATSGPGNTVAWDRPAVVNERPPQVGAVEQDDLVDRLDARRDAFHVELHFGDEGVEFSNLEGRGTVQLPVEPKGTYEMRLRVQRMAGDNSFGVSVPLDKAGLFALVDHKETGRWRSGLAYFDANDKLHFADAHEGQLLTPGRALDLLVSVNAMDVTFRVLDPSPVPATVEQQSQESAAVATTRWQGEPSRPGLGGFGPHYSAAPILHVFQSGFRVHSVRVVGPNGAVAPPAFAGESATAERQLAERVLWRGGELSLAESTGNIASLEKLPAEPWIEGVAKRDGSPRLAIDDRDVAQLAAIPGLKSLDLRGSDVSGEALLAISGMASLEFLAFRGDGVVGDDLGRLRDLPHLRRLMLNNMHKVQDDDLSLLRRFPDLTVLCLSQCPVTDQGVIDHVAHLHQLEHLCLNYTRVNGEFLTALEPLRQLRELQLARTPVTKLDLDALAQLPRLEKLVLTGSGVNAEQREALQRAFPKLKVY